MDWTLTVSLRAKSSPSKSLTAAGTRAGTRTEAGTKTAGNVANLAWKTFLQQSLPLVHLALVQHGGHFLIQSPQFLHDRCSPVLSNLIQPLHVSQKNGFHLIALLLR